MELKRSEKAAILIAVLAVALALGVNALRRRAPADFAMMSHREAAAETGEIDARININTASAAMLETLPGIGETLAGRIVAYREENGGFRTCEDIMQVRGIGRAKFEDIRELITTGDDSG